ncbi:hypothetical protein [Thalassorhabdomicrobium marinisediminis]|uniref:hypothetical protein n=1 Tax=Thalassorhabdomicrobium marinisediminis TaxID=2170577 RepID=UPI0011B1ECCC|nr:hypothetical protein [Thalassorhabdomicrobium marinisediminis]
MKRTLIVVLHVLPFGATLACTLWLLAQAPFAAPLVQRSAAGIEVALSRAMARKVDADWLVPRLQAAVADEDLMRIELLVDLAISYEVAVPPALKVRLQEVVDAQTGFFASALGCGACAVDVTACATLTQISACAIPFELTPAGDVNALRRAALNYGAGDAVDRLDLGLALVGLGATGAVLATGGSSYTVKAGASVLRMARRMGELNAAFAARLAALAGDAVRWDRMGDLARFRIGPAEVVDSAKLGKLSAIGSDLGRLAENTSVAQAVTLLRHVDSAEDAARLARVSAAMGPRTGKAFAVLGKARVFRAAVRLTDLALGAVAALAALAAQALVFVANRIGNAGLRGLRRALATTRR